MGQEYFQTPNNCIIVDIWVLETLLQVISYSQKPYEDLKLVYQLVLIYVKTRFHHYNNNHT